MKVDLHTHTVHSHDACSSLRAYMHFVERRGLDCVAVTDHNEIEGALALQRTACFQVIVGEEIKTKLGDLIGLFLTRRIAPGLAVADTIDAIKEQGGIVYVPHPSWPHPSSTEPSTEHGGRETLAAHLDRQGLWSAVDGVEVVNGRTLQPQPSMAAIERATAYNLFQGGGSDAHTPFDLGRAYAEMEEFETPAGFLASAAHARVCGIGGTRRRRVVLNRFVRKAARRMVLGAA